MPRKPDPGSLEALIREVRRTFQALRAASDDLHRDLGVTAAMRAVMEHLADDTPRTVPEIARDKNVTRQHIQQIATALLEAGMLRVLANPRHQTSPLLALTPRGSRTFTEIRKREAIVLADVAERLPDADLDQATTTLRHLIASFERRST